MRLYLESLDLFDHVTGTAAAPGEDASDEARRNFNLGAKKAWTLICLAIEPEQKLHLREMTTAKEAGMLLKDNLLVNHFYRKWGYVNNIIPVVFIVEIICWSILVN